MKKDHLSLISKTSQSLNNKSEESKHKNILIVEDNLMARTALKNILLKLDEEPDIACDGEQAIEKIKQHSYRLILMDIGLPGKDGCEVTQFVRAWEQKNQLEPSYIIAQSSHLDKELEKQCIASGMNACYSKPLSEKTIADLIKMIICHA